MKIRSLVLRTAGAGIAAALLLGATSGCSTSTSIAKITGGGTVTLAMSVGTIDDPNGTLGFAGTTLNVVSSFRNSLGNSAYQNPGQFSLTGPGGAINVALPAGCAQLFSYGLAPACGVFAGQPPAYSPANSIAPGYATGFIVSGAPATAGGYTLSTTVPVNGTNQMHTANAALPGSPTVLPAEGGVTGFVSDGAGGGTFTITQPAGVTESLVVVISGGSEVATVETNSTTATITGSGTACPAGPAAPIPCGAFLAVVVGADYPMVEAGPPASHSANPTLAGGGGTSDLTVSGIANLNE
jgi:hypothetical protein